MTMPPRLVPRLAAVLLWVAWAVAGAAAPGAAALRATHAALQTQLRASPFGEPLVLGSREQPGRLEGDVHAEVPHPLAEITRALNTPAGLCEMLFLHLNVRACTPGTQQVALEVGPKRASSLATVHPMRYAVRIEAVDGEWLQVTLTAPDGPMGTQDYRIVLEAVAIDDTHSFVHLGYAYRYGRLAKLALDLYLATAGHDKIGFSIVGREPDGRPRHLQGERAALERNVMRYHLALRAVLGTPGGGGGTPEALQLARLRAWFALTERHAAQLHEYTLEEYLQEKRQDLARARAR